VDHPGTVTPLAQLLAELPDASLVQGDPDTPIAGIAHDTRRLEPGELFVAIPGFRLDALALVPDALARGAAAVVAEARPPSALPRATPFVRVPSARLALARLACAFYDHPSRRLSVVGITGTDGKTSTAHLLSAVLEAAGRRTGWLTTVNTKIGDQLRPNAAENTTPEATVVQRSLAEMVARHVDVAILETSSHALELARVAGTRFRVAVFTNLSPEHLNFHGSLDAYRAAKAKLFAMLPPDGVAVLNADDPSSAAMRAATRARVVTYGLDAPADVTAEAIELGAAGTSFRLRAGPLDRPIRTRLVGRFNVANWLAAYAAAAALGASADDLALAAARQPPVPGRMNLVDAGQPFAVVVDFAHTPQALDNALATVRGLAPGRVLLVFGLAGGRDADNRAVMGALAARRADYFVVTMDDPGEEDPLAIARAIAAGATEAGARPARDFVVDVDRRSAIRRVLGLARPGDLVLLAGKGHEQRMVVGAERLPWNDARVAADELARLGHDAPPTRSPDGPTTAAPSGSFGRALVGPSPEAEPIP
jgi:UDP-N-acetylmuramoyl-L-alanyl-D-glutamate--2,6-diaminopimelate ligase